MLGLISGTFPGFLLIATNVQAMHERIKMVWLSKSQPESEVWELFRSFAFMVLTWFILTNLPSDMVCYLYFKHITLDPTGTLVLFNCFFCLTHGSSVKTSCTNQPSVVTLGKQHKHFLWPSVKLSSNYKATDTSLIKAPASRLGLASSCGQQHAPVCLLTYVFFSVPLPPTFSTTPNIFPVSP